MAALINSIFLGWSYPGRRPRVASSRVADAALIMRDG
jgi:hypothetical protein